MQERFTKKAKEAVEKAEESAVALGHNYVGTEHILLGLLETEECVASKALELQNVSADDAVEKIELLVGTQNGGGVLPQGFTPRAKRILDLSVQEAIKMGAGYVGTEHILLALIGEQDSIAVKILELLDVSCQKLYEDIMGMLGEEKKPGSGEGQGNDKSGTPTLDKYSRDFTKLARQNRFDPIVGRDKEIERVVQILSRRTKNNPCLVGDPGVGKTAVIEGLAQKIATGDIPEILRGKRVVSIDLSSMVAGSKYRGEFEERIKKVLEEVRAAGEVVLFIDEIHTIIGAGGAEGAIDASNILKPSLARGEIQLIGATTQEEYRKYIEKDAALERRFQPVTISEPSEEAAIQMLFGLRDKYEAHHRVKITDAAMEAAVRLSSRYITDRFLPDKAIDLMDEAASKVRLKSYVPPENVKDLEDKLSSLEKEKEAAIKTEEFERAGQIKKEQMEIKKKLAEAKEKWQSNNNKGECTVDVDEIADVIANWTGVPVKSIQEAEGQRLLHMEELLHQRVIGQEEAITSIAKAIRRGRVGLKDPNRPIGSFLFLGPTGVGKTELSKALAEVLFGDEDSMIRIDMSEYMERFSVSKLIGAPPGYVGYDEGGQLSEKVKRKPYSVVLFDEIEKASPDVFNVLLQVLDDGHITDGQGRKIDFKNTVIIMTSNVGARTIIEPKKLGFTIENSAERTYKDMKGNVMDEVKQTFKPEFINRIDDIVVFHPLNEENVKAIVRLLAQEIRKRVKDNMEIELEFTDPAIDNIAKAGYDPAYGARPLKRALQSRVEDRFAEEYLQGNFKKGCDVLVNVEKGELSFKLKKKKSSVNKTQAEDESAT